MDLNRFMQEANKGLSYLNIYRFLNLLMMLNISLKFCGRKIYYFMIFFSKQMDANINDNFKTFKLKFIQNVKQ